MILGFEVLDMITHNISLSRSLLPICPTLRILKTNADNIDTKTQHPIPIPEF